MKHQKGYFSKNFLSLRLQLDTLLMDAGADQAIELLDTMTLLAPEERALLLGSFNRVAQTVLTGERIIPLEQNRALQSFENGLYLELLEAMQEAGGNSKKNQRLSVVPGGKKVQQRALSR